MNDPIHEKIEQLADEIEKLGAEVEQKVKDKVITEQELLDFKEKLTELNNQLNRLIK